MADSNDAHDDNVGANDTSIAEQELRTRELQIREREVKNNHRLSILKVIITGAVATLIPAIINWQIQTQNLEIERLKNEQSYLTGFAKEALQEDINKRYHFADYLATVGHSEKSRERWNAYRNKIEQVFNRENAKEQQIKDLEAKIQGTAVKQDQKYNAEISKLTDELSKAARELRSLRERNQTQGAPPPSDFEFIERYGESSIRFKVRNLNLNNQGNALFVRKGGHIEATMEIMHDCQECGGAINQIIVGIGDEERAQGCVWNGLQSSNGWKTVAFTLRVQQTAGVYYVRTRYAQAYGCEKALDWWRISGNGPTAASNIGVIVVAP